MRFLAKYCASACAGAIIALGAMGPSQAADLKIGALYPFSGGLALLGDESFRGAEMAVAERNAAGGVNGQQIKLFKADAVDANQAVGEARRLTSVDNVAAIFGSYSSSISFAATQVAELAGVPYFELGAISDEITSRGYKNVYRSNPTAKDFSEASLDALVKIIGPALKIEPKDFRIAIIYEDGLYGTTVSGFQKKRAKELGLNVVESLPYSAKAVDLSSLILRLKGAKADVVLQTSYQTDTILYFKQAKAAGFTPKAVIGVGGGYSLLDTAKALGSTMDGAFDIDFPQYATNEAGAPGMSAFVEAYKKRYGTAPRSGHSLANYVGAQAFLDILANAKSTDKDKIRAAVMAYEKPVGTTATGWGFKFNEAGQNERVTLYLAQWQGGKLITVGPEKAAVAPPIFPK